MRENFDPWAMVPEDDEEALKALERPDELVTKNLHGIYRCQRAKGEDVQQAFLNTLLAHVAAADAARQEAA